MTRRTQSAPTPSYFGQGVADRRQFGLAKVPFLGFFVIASDSLAGVAERSIAPRQRLAGERQQRQREHFRRYAEDSVGTYRPAGFRDPAVHILDIATVDLGDLSMPAKLGADFG